MNREPAFNDTTLSQIKEVHCPKDLSIKYKDKIFSLKNKVKITTNKANVILTENTKNRYDINISLKVDEILTRLYAIDFDMKLDKGYKIEERNYIDNAVRLILLDDVDEIKELTLTNTGGSDKFDSPIYFGTVKERNISIFSETTPINKNFDRLSFINFYLDVLLRVYEAQSKEDINYLYPKLSDIKYGNRSIRHYKEYNLNKKYYTYSYNGEYPIILCTVRDEILPTKWARQLLNEFIENKHIDRKDIEDIDHIEVTKMSDYIDELIRITELNQVPEENVYLIY